MQSSSKHKKKKKKKDKKKKEKKKVRKPRQVARDQCKCRDKSAMKVSTERAHTNEWLAHQEDTHTSCESAPSPPSMCSISPANISTKRRKKAKKRSINTESTPLRLQVSVGMRVSFFCVVPKYACTHTYTDAAGAEVGAPPPPPDSDISRLVGVGVLRKLCLSRMRNVCCFMTMYIQW